MAKVHPNRKKISKKVRQYLYEHNDGHCVYCGRPFGKNVWREIDHIIPVSRGGKNNIENLIVCCQNCNARKSTSTLDEFRERLNKKYNINVTFYFEVGSGK
jgi:5-methylcytosine-specific restriction endonuclease McrA